MEHIHQLLRDLEAQLRILKSELLGLDCQHSHYQSLSFASHSGTEFIPPSVKAPVCGYEALNAGAHAFTQIFREPDQEPLSVFRACGVITGAETLLDRVGQINALKDEIKAEITAIPRRSRDKVKNQYHAGLILKQVYRHIPVFKSEAITVSCSWVKSGSSTTQSTKAALIENLERLKAGRAKAYQTHSFITQDLERIRAYPDNHIFKVLRPTRPHTRYKVKDFNGGWHDLQAHLPLIMAQSSPIEYKALTDSVESSKHKLDKSGAAIIPWLGVLA